MLHKNLYLLAEGNDDTRFLKSIIKPIFDYSYKCVYVRQYAQLKSKSITKLIKSITESEDHYFYFRDLNAQICITQKKQKIVNDIPCLEIQRIIIVVKKIEGWYLAGLDITTSNMIGIKYLDSTDSIAKRKFGDLMPDSFTSQNDFMIEILKFYSIEVAVNKNKSFGYFINKHSQSHLKI